MDSICIHKDMTLDWQNMEYSKLMSGIIDFELDPFRHNVAMPLKDKYLLNKMLSDFKHGASEKIVRFITDSQEQAMAVYR